MPPRAWAALAPVPPPFEATAERVSLGWLMDRLGERSFGIILLLLAFLALIPGVSSVAGTLLTVPAFR